MNRVIRPGPLQYAYLLLVPAIPIALGIATLAAGFSAEPSDWGSRLPSAASIMLLGLIPAAYVFGMSVELTDASVSKVFLFGLLRETIPLARMAANISTERDTEHGFDIQYVNFATIDGRGAFTLLRGWVWPGRDVDDLFVLARHMDTDMRRKNWILAAFALALPLSGLGIMVAAVVLFLSHLILHWPS